MSSDLSWLGIPTRSCSVVEYPPARCWLEKRNVQHVKAHANGRNKCQQLPTLLGVVGQQCCVRLYGPKSLTGFKLYATSANNCQHCCGSMQTDTTNHNIVGPNNVGCCWPTMLGPFAWAFTVSSCRGVYYRLSAVVNLLRKCGGAIRLMQLKRHDDLPVLNSKMNW